MDVENINIEVDFIVEIVYNFIFLYALRFIYNNSNFNNILFEFIESKGLSNHFDEIKNKINNKIKSFKSNHKQIQSIVSEEIGRSYKKKELEEGKENNFGEINDFIEEINSNLEIKEEYKFYFKNIENFFESYIEENIEFTLLKILNIAHLNKKKYDKKKSKVFN
jgi:hypothetical protein